MAGKQDWTRNILRYKKQVAKKRVPQKHYQKFPSTKVVQSKFGIPLDGMDRITHI